jgi:hypothetical protein
MSKMPALRLQNLILMDVSLIGLFQPCTAGLKQP